MRMLLGSRAGSRAQVRSACPSLSGSCPRAQPGVQRAARRQCRQASVQVRPDWWRTLGMARPLALKVRRNRRYEWRRHSLHWSGRPDVAARYRQLRQWAPSSEASALQARGVSVAPQPKTARWWRGELAAPSARARQLVSAGSRAVSLARSMATPSMATPSRQWGTCDSRVCRRRCYRCSGLVPSGRDRHHLAVGSRQASQSLVDNARCGLPTGRSRLPCVGQSRGQLMAKSGYAAQCRIGTCRW